MSLVVSSSLVYLWGCLGTLCRCGDCDPCTVVCVACVYAERVWGCENTGVDDGWGVVVVSARHVGNTRGSGILSSAADVLGMSVVRGMRGVGGVCEMSVFGSGRRRKGDESLRVLGLGVTNPVGTGEVVDVCLGCGGVGGVGRGLGTGSGRMVWCYIRVNCESGFIVVGGYLGILCAPSVQSCCTLWISVSYRVFVYDIYRKSRLVYGRYRKSRLVCV